MYQVDKRIKELLKSPALAKNHRRDGYVSQGLLEAAAHDFASTQRHQAG